MFFQKLGNNSFAPFINVTDILLDNQIVDTSVTNGIEIDISIKSKQNFVDQLLSDSEYLAYNKISFFVFDSASSAINFANTFINDTVFNFNPNNFLLSVPSTTQTKTISISEYIEQDQVTGEYSGLYETGFKNLENNKDIILLVIPWIDFSQFANDNQINESYLTNALKNIYKNQVNIYTILQNNNVPVNNIISDMRDLNLLKTNLFSLLPISNVLNFDVLNTNSSKQQYFFDIYKSVNSDISKVTLFTVFNLKSFTANFSTLKVNNEKALSLLAENPIIINVTKKYSTSDQIYSVGNFSLTTDEIIDAGDINATYYLTLENNMVISFDDNVPSSTTNVTYEFEVLFSDPVLKYYYINDISVPCLYNSVISAFASIQSTVTIDNPNISDVKTGKFTNSFKRSLNRFENTVSDFVDDYSELLNLFLESENKITNETKTKIKNLLNINKSNIYVYIDFYYYVTNTLQQIENLFSQIKNNNTTYYKIFDPIKFDVVNGTYEITGQSFNKSKFDTLNVSKSNFVQLQPQNITSLNETTYLIKNTVVSKLNQLNGFSTILDQSTYFNESAGLTLKDQISEFTTKEVNGKKTISKKVVQPVGKLLNNSFTANSATSFNTPFSTETFGNSNLKDILVNSNSKTIQASITSNQLKDEFISSISTNTNTTAEELIPQVQNQYLTFENKKLVWKIVEGNLFGKFLIRTAYYNTGKDLFSKMNVQPSIANEYRVETIVPLQTLAPLN